ncbi:polyisoprenoid-binding protein [Campylobacter sp. faydin G-24]|uniref:Polyisoprenoid-binding protein n=1 Tax=Campylobacter anatolicus TaxID=2829105 RepID=A0ABS5HGB1_9BACT|nr:YceI family protein [Campylobacter anatolicus]MBR8463316.1 polyisoprenoid-binding protein [Campylobacter anatolicus]
MKNTLKASLIAIIFALSANATNYEIDPNHSNVGFEVKHFKISKVNGNFKSYKADIDYDKTTNIFNKFDVTIDTSSINTQNDKRDEHLRTADFFDVSKFDKIKFKMTKFEKDGNDEGKIYGDLTMKGITKPIVLDFDYHGENKNAQGKEIIGFSLESKILRSDFGIGGGFADATISDRVNLEIDVEAKAK